MSRTAVILLAAGSGARMNGSVADKVLAPLAGRPVFAHSAAAFIASGMPNAVAMPPKKLAAAAPACCASRAWSSSLRGESSLQKPEAISKSGMHTILRQDWHSAKLTFTSVQAFSSSSLVSVFR